MSTWYTMAAGVQLEATVFRSPSGTVSQAVEQWQQVWQGRNHAVGNIDVVVATTAAVGAQRGCATGL